jgi:hypothetical protein
MNALFNMSQHAITRTAQRNLKADELNLAMQIGTEVGDGILVLEKDIKSFVCEKKREIEQAQRLVGIRVVNRGECLITAYRVSRAKQRRLLRLSGDRSLVG